MSGSTVIMAPAGYHSSSSAYSPTSSSGLSPSQSKTHLLHDDSAQRPSSGHRRALSDISLPNLPSFEVPSFDNDFELDTSVFNKGKSATSDKSASYAALSESPSTPQRFSFARTRTGPISERPRSWFPSSRSVKAFALDSNLLQHESQRDEAGSQQQDKVTDTRRKPSLERSMTTSDTFASFAKRSWLSSSRSSSPQANERPRTATLDTAAKTVDTDEKASGKQNKSRKRPHFIDIASLPRPSSDCGKVATPKAIVKASTYLNKLKQKQASFTGSGTESDASSATSFAGPPSTSTDTRTSQSTSESDCPTADEPAAPKPGKDEDPLWSSFKTLELDFKGFTSKQTNQKIIQVQEVLMPFLCRTSPDDTIRKLSSENVERRASILNKWWSAILDMIDGSGQQPIPGVDRPFILETTLMIMMRSEWRQPGSGFLPLAERSPTEHVRSRTLTESTLGSSQAAFLNESAEHNVRTMFVSNLVKQMGIVVDKMSLRDAPLSLVNFSGKTCAYAFFFAPGIADVLLRLWGLTPDLIKRTASAFGLPRRSKGESDDIVSLFPENLANFGWTSHRMLWDGLKRVPRMPLLVARIAWTGPWVSRWKGLDTDLFFIFTKYFHVLAEQFMPTELPLIEKARSPAFVLVQAQLLAVLDTTIHRQAALQQAQQLPAMDSDIGVDATALAMPLSPSNMMKSMADNTLVVLLRNVLSDDTHELHGAKQTFAEAFGMLMKAAARRTSRYDNASCFSLCDFLEETFRLYDEYDDMLDPSARMDWKFWIDVFKMMMGSHNTMSEVRMLSFVFSIWDVLTRTPEQKTTLCMDWLLNRETFECFFNHWCPMVRAYYQRLLCWRVCRDVGRANEADTNIFMTVAARLKMVWAHYLYLKHDAALAGRMSPSTAPTLPTPGKKFIIIRHEVNTPQPGLFMGFDSFAKLPNNATTTLDAAENDSDERPESKKRWSLIGKMLGIGNGEESEKEAAEARSTQEKNLQDARQEVAETRGRSLLPPRPPPKPSTSSDSICSSPVFEEQKHIFRFVLGWQQPAPPPRDRMLTKPRLPGPAQARVTVRTRGGSPPPPHASRPPVTRAFSGSPVVGLINGARNASPAADSGDTTPRRPSATLMRSVSSDSGRASQTSEDTAFLVMDDSAESSPSPAPVGIGLMEPMTKPVKPTGIYTKNAVYCGRALAEWSLVVFECNNFVDRRREEGVLGLSEVEVPVLGMEGFRKLGG